MSEAEKTVRLEKQKTDKWNAFAEVSECEGCHIVKHESNNFLYLSRAN